jgi:hypothetical protein
MMNIKFNNVVVVVVNIFHTRKNREIRGKKGAGGGQNK